MIKHVVMWKFKQGQEEKMNEFINGLLSLKGQIPELKSIEVGKNVNKENAYQAVLITTFDSLEDLEKYKVDPRHVEISNLCKSIREDRVSVDFVVEE